MAPGLNDCGCLKVWMEVFVWTFERLAAHTWSVQGGGRVRDKGYRHFVGMFHLGKEVRVGAF